MTFEVSKLEDLYHIQMTIKKYKYDSKIKWILQEMANNIIEYQERGKIHVHENYIITMIDLKTLREECYDTIKNAIMELNKKDKKFQKIKSRNNYNYGGYGFKAIHEMGFEFKLYRTKNNLAIVCKKR